MLKYILSSAMLNVHDPDFPQICGGGGGVGLGTEICGGEILLCGWFSTNLTDIHNEFVTNVSA